MFGAQLARPPRGRAAQPPRPPQAASERDAPPRRDDAVHGAEGGEADHEVQPRGDARAADVLLVAVRAGDEQVEDEREAQREHQEAAVAERTQHLEADVAERARHAAAVSSRNACSRPAVVISMSRAPGWAASRARIAASESVQLSTTTSPRRSTAVTPSSASSSPR